jgi:hypothetical protein
MSADVLQSLYAVEDAPLAADPHSPFWQPAPAVYAELDFLGNPLPEYRTEIRSRWSATHLSLFFTCPYTELYLKPNPVTARETFALWDWDVAELFLGVSDAEIRRYKEFDISPQSEWVDLDVNLDLPDHTAGWAWQSGCQVAARIASGVWYGALRIPFASIDAVQPATGRVYRANLFRTHGSGARRAYICWRAPMSNSFHVPERFGRLLLCS